MKTHNKYIDCELTKPSVPLSSPTNTPRTSIKIDNLAVDYNQEYNSYGYGC
jgi:hypothetical protein